MSDYHLTTQSKARSEHCHIRFKDLAKCRLHFHGVRNMAHRDNEALAERHPRHLLHAPFCFHAYGPTIQNQHGIPGLGQPC